MYPQFGHVPSTKRSARYLTYGCLLSLDSHLNQAADSPCATLAVCLVLSLLFQETVCAQVKVNLLTDAASHFLNNIKVFLDGETNILSVLLCRRATEVVESGKIDQFLHDA
jgi:hypothetical protein